MTVDFKQDNAAWMVSTAATADVCSRIFFTILTLCMKLKARYIYLAGVLCQIALRFGMVLIALNIFQGFLECTRRISRFECFYVNFINVSPIKQKRQNRTGISMELIV